MSPFDFLNRDQLRRMALYRIKGQRMGQAFFNVLAGEQQSALINTPYDPFAYNDREAVQRAVDYLERS